MIRVEQLTAERGDFCLGPVDLTLNEGSYLTILGPSGAGKTIFLETCMGLLAPSSGRIWLNDRDATNLAPEDRHISYLPQDLTLFPHLSARDNMMFGAKHRKLETARSNQGSMTSLNCLILKPLSIAMT